ncbi:DUF6431 domain-containing protein, partial [Streptomyces sp. NPDC051219]|uniref:DUF6431 domain-containing protein n=1 Tax=Streptomyces sp. NPDC051219 TaxID=3155283 RepID=UPI0034322EF8
MLSRLERFRLIAAGQAEVLVLIVDSDALLVERQLRAGQLECPLCSSPLAPWGHGRPRSIRGDLGARLFLRPRRTRCSACKVTHVLLAEAFWPRRTDVAEVIGAGLEIAALGMGHRQVAARLGLAEGTVRGWLRAFARRAEDVRRHFTVALVALADDPVMPAAAPSTFADAVSVVAGPPRGGGAEGGGGGPGGGGACGGGGVGGGGGGRAERRG